MYINTDGECIDNPSRLGKRNYTDYIGNINPTLSNNEIPDDTSMPLVIETFEHIPAITPDIQCNPSSSSDPPPNVPIISQS